MSDNSSIAWTDATWNPVTGCTEVSPELRRREMRVEWMTDLVSRADERGIPVFVKQDSGLRPGQRGRIPDYLWARKEYPL